MPKTFEILKYFPDFHQAVDRSKLLYHVVDVIASRLQEIENDMVSVMKAHWIETAEDFDDLEKIAALYGIEREDYEDMDQFRAKVKDIIRLYLAGPGTVPSIIEFIAIALRRYNVEIERDEEGNAEIIHPVNGGEFRSQSRIYFGDEEDYIEIYENRKIEKSYRRDAIRHGETWFQKNGGFLDYYPEITFYGYDTRTINPILFNKNKGCAIGFGGMIAKNNELKIKANKEGYLDSAILDDKDVKNRIFIITGYKFDKCKFDEATFAIYEPKWASGEIGCAQSLEGEENPPIRIPSLPVGESEWEFRIAKSRFNCSRFYKADADQQTAAAAFTLRDEPVGIFNLTKFNKCVFLIDPSAGLEMKGEEHQRAMFEVLLPRKLETKQTNSDDAEEQERQFIEPLQRVRKIVERVKPAGVKAVVKYKDEPKKALQNATI